VTTSFFPQDGRIVVVAIDHPLYSWPCAGLEDRRGPIERSVAAGADAFIGAYGTLRDLASSFGAARRILKLDLTTVALHSHPLTSYRLAWSIEDAARLGVDAVLTYVQVGGPGELEALCAAAQVAAAADAAGLPYICESMPVESPAFPDARDPLAVAAATRGGTVVFFGGCAPGTTVPLDTRRVHYEELTLVGAFHHTPETIRRAVELLDAGAVNPEGLLTHRMGLADVRDALDLMSRGEALKVLIQP